MTVLDTNEQETSRWVPDGSVERYHELLTDEVAADSWAHLERQM